ncbi:hypothetical protein WHR41_08574 [Cladosporium halotolerans]|uniref:Uncharacterized protein n=1 Tax=Cladosporium halotolerans TaxID=1052096 RepID=A0AB34KG17_9PEZI
MALAHALTTLLFTVFYAFVQAQSTTVVSLTSTTTIYASATDLANACNNFSGACVVYGDNDAHGAPYTTTVYRGSSPTPTSVVTSTTIVQATATVTDANACQDFDGACVVYAGSGEAAYTTTASGYRGGQAGQQQHLGNADGYIATHKGKAHTAVAAGASLSAVTWLSVLTCFGLFLGVLVV